jgi:hypothetical protein
MAGGAVDGVLAGSLCEEGAVSLEGRGIDNSISAGPLHGADLGYLVGLAVAVVITLARGAWRPAAAHPSLMAPES